MPLVASMVAAFSISPASAGSGAAHYTVDDTQLTASTTTVGGIGGAPALNTLDTVPHWFGQTTDPHDGVTYGYNMVGTDPSKTDGTTTVQVDITPVNVNLAGGFSYPATPALVSAVLSSPQFATNDYGSTVAATAAGSFPAQPSLVKGSGGQLSQADAGNQLQLEDATFRAQFNKTGSSNYHLNLHPNVLPAVTINVPQSQGVLLTRASTGVTVADVNIGWWVTVIQNLQAHADPHHLPLYLTDNVLLHIGPNPLNCCVIGFHGAGLVPGRNNGSVNGNGNQQVQTYAWASWTTGGFYNRPDGRNWALQDIHALSHEISEWADDPFVNNWVEPWLTPTAPQYGCTNILETGDPVVAIGFAMGTNTYDQGPNPLGSQSADGYYHPEDETLLPWFMRLPSNATGSEPNQTSAGGRYTFMGDLNPFPGFRQAATGC